MHEKVYDRLREFLHGYKLKKVDLAVLQGLFSGGLDYGVFARAVLRLEDEGALKPVKVRGRNNKRPALANRYHLRRALINPAHLEMLRRMRLRLDPRIKLDHYYKAGRECWERDRPWLEKLDAYLKTEGLPTDPAPAPERSYQVFGNEKWLDEEGGRQVLERAGVSADMLGIVPTPEPLMWALSPAGREKACPGRGGVCHHLIMENKTPFQALLPVLPAQSVFTSLIYGRGKTIVSSLSLFCAQTGFGSASPHVFHYFGDLDREGIGIWHSLCARAAAAGGGFRIEPALPFYRALLARPPAVRPDYQREYRRALQAFLHYFTMSERETIRTILADGGYLPQEALSSREIREIFTAYECGARADRGGGRG